MLSTEKFRGLAWLVHLHSLGIRSTATGAGNGLENWQARRVQGVGVDVKGLCVGNVLEHAHGRVLDIVAHHI